MDVIYLDSLFGLNLLIDYCLVLVSARVCGVVLRRWRYALAALIGALYAALMVLPGFGWLANGMMKLALGAAMALIAFGGEAHLVRCTVVFFAVSAAFGGAVYAASMLAGVSPGSGALVTVSGRVLALSFAACYAARNALALLELLLPMEKWKREQLIPVLGQMREYLAELLMLRSGLGTPDDTQKKILQGRTGAELLAAANNLQTAIDDLNANVGAGAVIGWLSLQLR